MLYPKNVPNIERAARIIGGIILILAALFGGALTGNNSPVISALLVLAAALLMATGFIGWCPACAMVGRKLKQDIFRR